MNTGRFFVFEGPDNVGKTTLSAAVERALRASTVPCLRLSFPGSDRGTLGAHVHRLHHSIQGQAITPSALQLMHVAAHVDAIQRQILPALAEGITVLLDRFWWSTHVYASASGVGRAQVRAILEAEAAFWGSVRPTTLFLVERSSLQVDPALVSAYSTLAQSQSDYPIVRLDNNRRIRLVVADILQAIRSHDANALPALADSKRGIAHGEHSTPSAPVVFSSLRPAIPSPVYDTFWRFATARQDVFYRRFRGHDDTPPEDPILRRYKFTNAYRASDRVSQHLIRKVIYPGEQAPNEIFFRILLFKLFNRIATWQLLEAGLKDLSWRAYDFRRYDAALTSALASGQRIYSAAYIMPPARGFGDEVRKHRTHLQLLECMIRDDAPSRLSEARSLKQAFEILKRYPMMGDFLAFQFVIDLNYSTLVNFSEMEFIVPGPGARDGIRKCFVDYGGLSESDLIRLMADRQSMEFERLGLSFQTLWGRPLQLIDCQNLFCETDKYARLAHPEITGRSGRTRIKQIYRRTGDTIEYWYPPKWQLNEVIAQEYAENMFMRT